MTGPYCLHADIGDQPCPDLCASCYALETAPHWARRPAIGATMLHLVADNTETMAMCGAHQPGSREPWQPASHGLPRCADCTRLAR